MFRMILLELWLPNCAGVVKFLSTHLAPYKRPISIVVRQESLPRTTTRKLKRNVIKVLVSSGV